jgi:outer membrane biosynthesis protein TonB
VLLDQAALDAVRRGIYQPARIATRPVPVYLTVTLNFRLSSL